ncbi:MAG: PBSX family phage terminase large subunit [Bacillota bacterium]
MTKNKIAPFRFKPFSKKQLQVFTWWMKDSPHKDKDAIICDGSVRAGKTIAMGLSYVMWAMETFDAENLGMSGKTIGALRRNVVSPLKRMLKSRGYMVHDHRAENYLTISRNGRSNDFYLFGGKDERSQDLIQGITLAGMLFDEVALMPKSFVDQATARCSVEGSKLWFNCNPAGPFHWFRLEWLEQLVEKNALHLHFTMDDNLSLSQKVKDRYRRLYSGVFFKRFILGLWVMAEGIIYDMWDDNTHIVDAPTELHHYIVAIDYGTTNPCTFGLYGWGGTLPVYLVKEYWYDSTLTNRQKTDGEYADDFVKWLGNYLPEALYVDPSAASFIAELNKRGYQTTDANNSVLDGIRFVAGMLNEKQLLIDRSCVHTAQEFASYAWDPKAQQKGEDKPMKRNDHAMDRNRYAMYSHFGSYIEPYSEVYDNEDYDYQIS